VSSSPRASSTTVRALPSLPRALPWAFSCWGAARCVVCCSWVPTLSWLLRGRQLHSAHVGWSLHLTRAPALPHGEGLAWPESAAQHLAPGTSGVNQPVPPLQAAVFGTACQTCRRSCVPAQAMSPCPCPSSCAPPTRFGTLLSACPGPGGASSRAWGLLGC